MPIDKIQNKFVQQQLHNEQVLQNIETIRRLAETTPYQGVIQSLHQWHKTPPYLTVTNTLFWSLIGLAAVVFLFVLYFQWLPWLYLIVVGLVGFAIFKKANDKERDHLIDVLTYKVLSEKHQIKYNCQVMSHRPSQLMHSFPSFNLGNYSNEISDIASGVFTTEHNTHPFTLYRYHYVNEIETRDKDNNVTTHYTHDDRWGVFIDNIPINGISISTYQLKKPRFGHTWTTSDIKFNKKYQMSGNSEIELAKFFSPARVLSFEKILSDFGGDLYFHPELPILGWQFGTDIFQYTPSNLTSNTTFELAEKLETLQLQHFPTLKKNAEALLQRLH